MHPLVKDKATGYLSADNWNSFDVGKKQKFLTEAEAYVKAGKWPDVGMLCDRIGIDPRTLDRHLTIDGKFQEDFKKLTLRGKWKLESLMYKLSPKQPLFMFGWLRKWFPQEYNPNHQVTITLDAQTVSRDKAILDGVVESEAIEAETVRPASLQSSPET